MIFNIGVSAPRFPIFSAVIGGNTYQFNGSDIDNADLKVKQEGNYIKCWIYKTGSITFGLILKAIDACAVGKGATGGNGTTSRGERGQGTFTGGDGGRGGAVVNALNKTVPNGATISFSVGATNSITINGETISAAAGAGAYGGGGGAWSDYSGSGHDATNGAAGSYAFNDSSFDGIRYGGGGGGGKVSAGWYQNDGAEGATAGAKGHGGHGGRNNGDVGGGVWPGETGIDGIVLLRIPLL